MPIVTGSIPQPAHPSPKSVLLHDPLNAVVDQLILESPRLPKGPHGQGSLSFLEEGRMFRGQKRIRGKYDSSWTMCAVSKKAKRTDNPIRPSIEQVARRIRSASERSDGKSPISLASGDSTIGGNILPCASAMESTYKAVLGKSNVAGYANACGTREARIAIAKHHRIRPESVIVTNGCSGALDLALNALLDVGSTLLVPQPGFPLYEEIAKSIGANVVHYRLDPDKNWEIDFDHLESLLSSDRDFRAIMINNPSSPTGAVFCEHHLCQIVEFAQKHKLPIVADEIYGDITFGANKFHPMGRIAAQLGSKVPVITASGVSKMYLLPGWRVGWLCFQDNIYNSLREVQKGAFRLAQLNHGASNLAQAAIPTLLNSSTPGLNAWKDDLRTTLKRRADALCNRLSRCQGLEVIAPQGAMYFVVKVDSSKLDVEHDTEFAMRLVDEENVFVLPGTAMGVRNVFRVAFCSPEVILNSAASRIERFCHSIAKKKRSTVSASRSLFNSS